MNLDLVLASGSQIRADLLRNAGLRFDVQVARIDEDSVRQALQAEDASPRDIADTLAEMKARKVSDKTPGALVLGCDQVLSVEKAILAKPETPDEARDQLRKLRNRSHTLLSAAVLYEDGEPKWRHVGVVRLRMRDFSESYLEAYIERNWDSIRYSVGAYKLEEEGARLFTQVQGDYFTVLGLPLLELLNHLTLIGRVDG
jgi:septum formation protein